MTETILFSTGIVLTVVVSWIVVLYLGERLHVILTDLCSLETRARFWTAFTTVCLTLVPLIFALAYRPEPDDRDGFIYPLAAQLHDAMVGLFVTLLTVGFVLSLSIRSQPPAAPSSANRPA
jgi:uncharacterized membrane protein